MKEVLLYDKILSVLKKSELFEDEKALIIFSFTLKSQQSAVFNEIGIGRQNAVSCQDISNILGIETKNISTQITQIRKKFDRIKTITVENKKKYYII